MRLRISAVPFGLLLMASPAWAQSPPSSPVAIPVGDWLLSPSLEIRSRAEYWRDPVELGGGSLVGGGEAARVRDAGGVFERTRIGLGADKGPLRAQVTLQDSRAWGFPYPTATLGGTSADASAPSSLSAFGPYEAYVEAHTADETRASYLRLGRQVVVWGDGRLLGNADWSPAPRSLDALRGHVAVGRFDFEVLGAVLDSPTPSGAAFGQSTNVDSHAGTELVAAQAAWTIDPLLVIQAFGFARFARSGEGGATPDRSFAIAAADGETYTAALRIAGDKSGWRYALEGAYQTGTASDLGTSGVSRSAYAAAAYLSKRLDRLALTPTVRLGGAYASGDDGSGAYKQFDPLLPDTHVLHGAMDVFAWSNELEGNARVTVVPVTDTSIAVEYRYAQMARAGGEWLDAYLVSVGRVAGNASTSLGHEIDAALTWRPWTALDLAAGYSLFLLGDGARTLLAAQGRGALEPDGTYDPSGVAHYAYLQATLHVP